jgi:hypothetical protein
MIGAMRDEAAPGRPQRHARAAAQASRQWGNLTRDELRTAGFTVAEIRGMLERGELVVEHRGVYALGHRSPAPEARWAAGLLAAGPGSVLVGTSAAALHGLLAPRAVTEVAAPKQRRGDARLIVHRSRIHSEDIQVIKGLRVTTVCRTLLDLAAAGHPIDRLVHEATAARLVAVDDLRAYAADHGSARGGRRLHAALDRPQIRSRGERRLLFYLHRRGLPAPTMNARIGRLTVDAYFPELALAVELDHDQTHGSAYAARRDEWRDRYLRHRGLDTLRIGEDDFAVLAAELERRGAQR